MADQINGVNVPFVPVVKTEEQFPAKFRRSGTDSFESIFKGELESLKFSSHAAKRMETRNIQLSDEEMSKLSSAVDRAEAKGGVDSLIMVNNRAFVVNVPNRTVVTAVSMSEAQEKVFTNIDSVVFT